jgi:hypothetical protein
LKTDFKRIGHIARRARYAEEMVPSEGLGTELPVVLIAAYLWDLDSDDNPDGTPVAKSILDDLKAPGPLIEQVCKMIARRRRPGADGDGADTAYGIVAQAEKRAAEEKTK